jgi:hypothetical protein
VLHLNVVVGVVREGKEIMGLHVGRECHGKLQMGTLIPALSERWRHVVDVVRHGNTFGRRWGKFEIWMHYISGEALG